MSKNHQPAISLITGLIILHIFSVLHPTHQICWCRD